MKFAFIVPAKISNGGGAERWTEFIALRLSALGHTVDLYVPQDKLLPSYSGPAFRRESDFESTLYHFLKRIGLQGYYPALMFVRLPEDYDAVYSTSMFPILVFATVDSPLIVGTHDAFISNSPLSIDSLQLIPRVLYRFIRKNRRTLIHSLSKLTSEKFRNSPWPVEQVPIATSSVSDIPIADQSFRVVFIGSLEKRKGAGLLTDVVLALKAETEVKFTVIGKAPRPSSTWLARLRTSPQFEHLGYVPNEAKSRVLASSSLCLHLSSRETSPAVPLEALLSGVPVISTWVPLSRIMDSSGLEVIPGNVVAVTGAIRANYARWKSNQRAFLDMRQKIRQETMTRYAEMESREKMIQMITEFARPT